MRSRRLAVPPATAALAAALALVLAAPAGAAPPLPFGHACAPRDGALSCPTPDDASRVPAFDGVPLDVDVWLPATGDGPFPTIALLHGWGGDKSSFQGGGSYSAQAFAKQGYAKGTVPRAEPEYPLDPGGGR